MLIRALEGPQSAKENVNRWKKFTVGSGIRTHDQKVLPAPLAGMRLRPLGHRGIQQIVGLIIKVTIEYIAWTQGMNIMLH